MTKAELLALTMEDFDFEKNTVRINKSYQRLQGQDVITTPKTPKSNRTIKLPKFLAEEMQEYFAMLYDQTSTARIFLVTKSFLHHEMERGCKLSGVKKIRIHDLRHSHISHLIDLGFSAVAIADRVGHESIDITYRYSHLFPSKQVAMADRLDAVNASFENCEEQDGDIDVMQAEETAPIVGIANNINQAVKLGNSQGRLYYSDIDKLQNSLDDVKKTFGEVLEVWRLQRS